jgi:hypothetical protein
MSSRFSFAAGVLLASVAALPLSAQQSTDRVQRDSSSAKAPVVKGSASDSALVELGRAITMLAMSVQTVVDEAKKNPEVRRAALQTASTAVTVAQRALEENRGEIERLLSEASHRIADESAKQREKLEKFEKLEKDQKSEKTTSP